MFRSKDQYISRKWWGYVWPNKAKWTMVN